MLFKDATAPASVAEGGTVCGYASTFDREPDSYGDVIAQGAFAESLKRWEELGKPIPLLYGHNTGDPKYNIGMVTLAKEDERGLYVEAEFDSESECAQQVRHLVKTGRLYQFSFAFDVLDYGETELEDGTKANELRKLDLFEVSLVQIPANQHAEVTDVKGAKYGRRNSKADEDTLTEIRGYLEQAMTALDALVGTSDEVDGEDDDQTDGTEGGEGDEPKGREDAGGKAAELAEYLKQIEMEV